MIPKKEEYRAAIVAAVRLYCLQTPHKASTPLVKFLEKQCRLGYRKTEGTGAISKIIVYRRGHADRHESSALFRLARSYGDVNPNDQIVEALIQQINRATVRIIEGDRLAGIERENGRKRKASEDAEALGVSMQGTPLEALLVAARRVERDGGVGMDRDAMNSLTLALKRWDDSNKEVKP